MTTILPALPTERRRGAEAVGLLRPRCKAVLGYRGRSAQEGDGRGAPLQSGSGLWEHDSAQARWQAQRLVKRDRFAISRFGQRSASFSLSFLRTRGRWPQGSGAVGAGTATVEPAYVALATLTAAAVRQPLPGSGSHEHVAGTHVLTCSVRRAEIVDLHIKPVHGRWFCGPLVRSMIRPAASGGVAETNLRWREYGNFDAGADWRDRHLIGPTPITSMDRATSRRRRWRGHSAVWADPPGGAEQRSITR